MAQHDDFFDIESEIARIDNSFTANEVFYTRKHPSFNHKAMANTQAALSFAGITSRTTLLKWEKEGRFPKRIKLDRRRVGWLWTDLYAWADALKTVE